MGPQSSAHLRHRLNSKLHHQGLGSVDTFLHQRWTSEIMVDDNVFRPFAEWKNRYEPPRPSPVQYGPVRRILSKALDIVGDQIAATIVLTVLEYVSKLLELMAGEAASRRKPMTLDEFLDDGANLALLIPMHLESFANALSALACTYRFAGSKSRKFEYMRQLIVVPKLLQKTCELMDELDLREGINNSQDCADRIMKVMTMLFDANLSDAFTYISEQPIFQELMRYSGLSASGLLPSFVEGNRIEETASKAIAVAADRAEQVASTAVSAAIDLNAREDFKAPLMAAAEAAGVGASVEDVETRVDAGIQGMGKVIDEVMSPEEALKARLLAAAKSIGAGEEVEDVIGTFASVAVYKIRAMISSGVQTKMKGMLANTLHESLHSLTNIAIKAAQTGRAVANCNGDSLRRAFDVGSAVVDGLEYADAILSVAETTGVKDVVDAVEAAHDKFAAQVRNHVNVAIQMLKDNLITLEDDDE